jgi:hypothetical protein
MYRACSVTVDLLTYYIPYLAARLFKIESYLGRQLSGQNQNSESLQCMLLYDKRNATYFVHCSVTKERPSASGKRIDVLPPVLQELGGRLRDRTGTLPCV